MKIKITKADFVQAVTLCASAAARNLKHPTLKMAMLYVKGEELRMAGTDVQNFVIATAACEVLEEGVILVDADRLLHAAKDMPSPELLVESDDKHQLHIRSGTAVARIPGANWEECKQEFRTPPKEDAVGVPFSVLGTDFKKLVKGVMWAAYPGASADGARWQIQGVWITVRDPGVMICEGFNGSTLAVLQGSAGGGLPTQFFLPNQGITSLLSALPDCDIVIAIGKRAMIFDAPGVKIYSLMSEARRPDFDRVTPEDSEFTAGFSVERSLLLKAIGRVGVFTRGDDTQAVHLQKRGAALETSCHTAHGSHSEEVVVSPHRDADFAIDVGPDYLIDALKMMKMESVQLDYVGYGQPLVMREPGTNSMVLLMPRRIAPVKET